ncbi:hypothetical protein ACLHDG_09045 [Sulfurovum sp. CS9]|uniref:hypothetical protein n=1 Tax=Sulfurovum sp. CS9 TaxID=3391146 RepID=UPI0039EBD382
MNEIQSTADRAEHQGLMDSSGYHDIDSGEFIPLRNVSGGLGTDITGVEGTGDVTVYNTKTDTHHRVMKGTGSVSNSRDFIAKQEKAIKSYVVEENMPEASIAELKQQEINRKRRAKEAEEGHFGIRGSGVLLG